MNTESLEQAARTLMIEMFGLKESDLTADAHFKDDLDLDSIDLVDWRGRINDEHDLDLSPYDFEECRVLNDFVTVLRTKSSTRE